LLVVAQEISELEDELTEKKELMAKYKGKLQEWDTALASLSQT
jgi:hypothetical protein